jgi:MFS family permease
VGAVIGGIVVGALMRRLGEVSTIAWALVAIGVGMGLLVTAELTTVLLAAMFVGVAVSFYNVAFVTLIQRRTDVSMQGRVMSAIEAVFTVPYAGSIAAGALIVSIVDFRVVYLAEAAAFLLVAGYLAITLRGDRLRRPTPSPDRRRRRGRGRSSSRDARVLVAPPSRSEDRRPTP